MNACHFVKLKRRKFFSVDLAFVEEQAGKHIAVLYKDDEIKQLQKKYLHAYVLHNVGYISRWLPEPKNFFVCFGVLPNYSLV